MKKKIQALACAAMLAVGGFNVWTAVGCANETELTLENIEAIAGVEYMNGSGETLQWGRTKVSGTIGGGGSRNIKQWVCKYMQPGTGDGDCQREGDKKTESV